MRQIRYRQQQRLQLGLQLFQPRGRALKIGLDLRHFGHHVIGGLAPGFFLADRSGKIVTPRLQLLGARLQSLALRLERSECVHIEKRLWIFAVLQPRQDAVEVASQEIGV